MTRPTSGLACMNDPPHCLRCQGGPCFNLRAGAATAQADASRARPTASDVPPDASLPLTLQAAYGVYTALCLMDGAQEAPVIEVFLGSPDDVVACSSLAAVSLAVCGNSPHLGTLRTTALEVLQREPELGQRMVEALAGLDAQLQGKA